MRFALVALSALLSPLLSSCNFLPHDGENVTCSEHWVCPDGTENASATKVFCTDPDDPDRDGQIKQFEKDFGSTCAGVQEQCVGDQVATCNAECVAQGKCDVATAVPVVL
ncbi:MAG TPA: hypothetical protein VGO62_06145 [Myxococcota bacterium]|jgi:hypothetical protein